jgi:primase-polymerase (primpol)-like protein
MTCNPECRYNPSDFEPYLVDIDEPSHHATGSSNSASPPLDDDVILQKALGSRSSQKFAALWAGEIHSYPSPSEADEALCWELSFYTTDAVQIDRLFRRSGRMRDKWDEHPSYAERTIAKALEARATAGHYQGVSAERNGQPHVADEEEPRSLNLLQFVVGVKVWRVSSR